MHASNKAMRLSTRFPWTHGPCRLRPTMVTLCVHADSRVPRHFVGGRMDRVALDATDPMPSLVARQIAAFEAFGATSKIERRTSDTLVWRAWCMWLQTGSPSDDSVDSGRK